MYDNRFLDDAEEFFVRCCKNGLFAMNVDIWFDFVVETITPGARDRLLRTAKLAAQPPAEQMPQLKMKMRENPGIFSSISRSDVLHVRPERFFELIQASLVPVTTG